MSRRREAQDLERVLALSREDHPHESEQTNETDFGSLPGDTHGAARSQSRTSPRTTRSTCSAVALTEMLSNDQAEQQKPSQRGHDENYEESAFEGMLGSQGDNDTPPVDTSQRAESSDQEGDFENHNSTQETDTPDQDTTEGTPNVSSTSGGTENSAPSAPRASNLRFYGKRKSVLTSSSITLKAN